MIIVPTAVLPLAARATSDQQPRSGEGDAGLRW